MSRKRFSKSFFPNYAYEAHSNMFQRSAKMVMGFHGSCNVLIKNFDVTAEPIFGFVQLRFDKTATTLKNKTFPVCQICAILLNIFTEIKY